MPDDKTTSGDSWLNFGAPGAEGRPIWKRWQTAAIAVAGLAVMAVGIVLGLPAHETSKPPDNPAPRVQTRAQPPAPPQAQPRVSAPSSDSSAAPKWTLTSQLRWARDGSKAIGYELDAENEVSVWMKRVRPTLAVRCLARQIEVFVVTDSAASIEPVTDRHTVHVSLDGAGELTEQWLDSADHRELFSPNGAALASGIAEAQSMRFQFTPFNSSSVAVEFDVRGFAGPFKSVSKMCASAPAPKRGRL